VPNPNTFLDANVLISAVAGRDPHRSRALHVLENPARVFYYSPLLRLEVMLKPAFLQDEATLDIYRYFFKTATIFGDLNRIFEIGSKEALRYGIPVMDAMHLAAAHLTKSVFVTNERPDKPLYRTRLVEIAHFASLSE
jgi:predicted nucleic acid-binding protein